VATAMMMMIHLFDGMVLCSLYPLPDPQNVACIRKSWRLVEGSIIIGLVVIAIIMLTVAVVSLVASLSPMAERRQWCIYVK
jgi:hypothetical protein